MGYKNTGNAYLFHHFFQPAAQLLAYLGVNGCKGFVQKQHLWVYGQSPGKSHPLSLTAGKLIGIAVFQSRQSYKLQQFLYFRFDFLFPFFANLHAVSNVIVYCIIRKQCIILKHKADFSFLYGKVIDNPPVNRNVAAILPLQSGKHTQKRCFSASAGSQKGHQLSFFDSKGHVIRGFEISKVFMNMLKCNIHTCFLPLLFLFFRCFGVRQRCPKGL